MIWWGSTKECVAHSIQHCPWVILLTLIDTDQKTNTKYFMGPQNIVLRIMATSCRPILKKKEGSVALGSQKTTEMPFKVKFTL